LAQAKTLFLANAILDIGRTLMQNRTAQLIAFAAVSILFVSSYPVFVQAADWQQIATITGSSSQISSEFMANGTEWRIRWSYVPNTQFPDLTAFSFFVYPHGATDAYVGHVIQYKGDVTSGVLDVNDGTGLHYVRIVAANTPSYTLIVEYNIESVTNDSFIFLIVGLALGIPIILIVIISVLVRKRVKKRKLLASRLFPPPPPLPP
jgi:hypothetical protein